MAETYKVLAQNDVNDTATTVCAPPSGKQWIISSIYIANHDSADRTIALYINGSAAANTIIPATTIPLGGHWPIKDAGITLCDTDTLVAIASATDKISVTCFGAEVTP